MARNIRPSIDLTTYLLSKIVYGVEYEASGGKHYDYNTSSPEWTGMFEVFERRELGKLLSVCIF